MPYNLVSVYLTTLPTFLFDVMITYIYIDINIYASINDNYVHMYREYHSADMMFPWG